MTTNGKRIAKGNNINTIPQKSPVAPLIFRTKWWRFAPFSFIFFLLLIVPLGRGSLADSNGLVIFLGICLLGAVLLLPVIWVAFYTIALTESGVRKHIPLIETREIPYSKIRHIKVKVLVLRSRAIERIYMLWITDIRGAKIVVDMRMFRHSDLAVIVDALATRAPQARIDQAARALQAGQFVYRD